MLHVFARKDLKWYLTVQNGNLGQPRPGNIPMRRSNKGVCKHSTGEGWTSDINRPRTWDLDGPHHVNISHIPVTQVSYIFVLIDTG
jgi:hypothetical protein